MKFKTKDSLIGRLIHFSFKSSHVRRVAIDFGRVARFDSFLISQKLAIKRVISREKLYERMLSRTACETPRGGGPLLILEFGVADGDGTRFWSRNVKNSQMQYVGFDSFLGLSEDWMIDGLIYHPKGNFARNGHPDFSSDRRISFCVGLVEDEETKIVEFARSLVQKIYLFDMDLYKPTKFVWDLIRVELNHGDIVYFDEAFDLDSEGLIVQNEILSEIDLWEYLGHSAISIAFQYK